MNERGNKDRPTGGKPGGWGDHEKNSLTHLLRGRKKKKGKILENDVQQNRDSETSKFQKRKKIARSLQPRDASRLNRGG